MLIRSNVNGNLNDKCYDTNQTVRCFFHNDICGDIQELRIWVYGLERLDKRFQDLTIRRDWPAKYNLTGSCYD